MKGRRPSPVGRETASCFLLVLKSISKHKNNIKPHVFWLNNMELCDSIKLETTKNKDNPTMSE